MTEDFIHLGKPEFEIETLVTQEDCDRLYTVSGGKPVRSIAIAAWFIACGGVPDKAIGPEQNLPVR